MIAWLLAKIAVLETRLAAKNLEIAHLKRAITQLASKCRQGAESSAREMERGNVPQGRYGYLKGMNDFANILLRALGERERTPVKRSGLFKGIFKW